MKDRLIFFLLYSMFGSFKWAGLAMVSLALSPIGALFALYFTGTHFSVSSGIGTLALFGRGRRNGSHHDRVHQPATCTWLQR
jgi:heavy metal efflux system protein